MNSRPIALLCAIIITVSGAYESLPNVKICLDEVFSGLSHPTHSEYARGVLFVAEREGIIKEVNLPLKRARIVLDIKARVLTSNDPREERGLLGFTLPKKELEIYVSYSKKTNKSDMDHALVISKFKTTYHGSEISVDKDSETIVLEIDQPGRTKNGGLIFFGPDNLLYVTVGAGSPEEIDKHRFKKSSFLGKILRINVTQHNGDVYSVPKHNPYFLDHDLTTKKEIYASGFRNPWRCHVAVQTPAISDSEKQNGFRIICGDLGAGTRNTDEVSIVENGGVYGWMDLPETPCQELEDCRILKERGDIPVFNVLPIYTHKHEKTQALIGGIVYKGFQMTALKNAYVYGDYLHDSMHYLKENERGLWSPGNISTLYKDQKKMDPTRNFIINFTEDDKGEILAVKYKIGSDQNSTGGAIFRVQPAHVCNSATSTFLVEVALMTVMLKISILSSSLY